MIDEFYCFLMIFTHSNLLISITFAEENANNLLNNDINEI